jgi:signal transduction histidine kinase
MRLLPASITGQIIALVVVALVAAQALLVGLVVFGRSFGLPGDAPSLFVGEILAVVRMVDAATEEARPAIVAAASHAIAGITLLPADVEQVGAMLDPPMMAISDLLRHELGVAERVFRAAPAEARLIGVRLAGGDVLGVPLPAGRRTPPLTALLLFSASLGITMVILSAWGARQVTRPLTRAAEAAERFGVTLGEEPLDEGGPAELRQVNAALYRMRERLRALVADRTHMLSAIGHDLRTPLTRLRLRIETSSDEDLRGPALSEIRSIEALLNSALEYLRGAQTERRRESVRMAALLQTICDDFADFGAAITFEGPRHAAFLCDAELMGRAFTNLIDNAVRHGHSVTVRLAEDEDGTLAIEVADDGDGLDGAQKRLVLEPFQRVGAARGSKGGGFGLGLTIARNIIEGHGGTITLEDNAPQGLLVRVRLRLLSA